MFDLASRCGRPCHPVIATKYTLSPLNLMRNSPSAQEKQNQHWDFKHRRPTSCQPHTGCPCKMHKVGNWILLKNPKPNNLPSSIAQLCKHKSQSSCSKRRGQAKEKPQEVRRSTVKRKRRDNLELDLSTQQLLISSQVFHCFNVYLTELTMVFFICLVIFNLCCFTVRVKTRHYCQYKESLLTW